MEKSSQPLLPQSWDRAYTLLYAGSCFWTNIAQNDVTQHVVTAPLAEKKRENRENHHLYLIGPSEVRIHTCTSLSGTNPCPGPWTTSKGGVFWDGSPEEEWIFQSDVQMWRMRVRPTSWNYEVWILWPWNAGYGGDSADEVVAWPWRRWSTSWTRSSRPLESEEVVEQAACYAGCGWFSGLRTWTFFGGVGRAS